MPARAALLPLQTSIEEVNITDQICAVSNAFLILVLHNLYFFLLAQVLLFSSLDCFPSRKDDALSLLLSSLVKIAWLIGVSEAV